ncbi:hypothetical protein FRACA_100032 [Frankia canadensis]|uniref:Uncharacterized protein n=1 Tax=Frankia canadensis TaxID=1836972 RepID=A0A2I2KII5_9ACTN|nr:hypothetical protein FRACA_100032 [Frankia canadensis]SOU52754.1 hypothetical protein FRACA_100032 [Frankia canadensis]
MEAVAVTGRRQAPIPTGHDRSAGGTTVPQGRGCAGMRDVTAGRRRLDGVGDREGSHLQHHR